MQQKLGNSLNTPRMTLTVTAVAGMCSILSKFRIS
jgi:hypothetical protein